MDCDPPNSNHSFVFLGSTGEEFTSLPQQADSFLDNYWPNWKNYARPESYLIPFIFRYKFPEINDQIVSEAKPRQAVSTRAADIAEHIIYKTIEELIQDRVNGPFIAVRGLDLSKDRSKSLLRAISNQRETENLKCFREYDFILIGPKLAGIKTHFS